MDTAPAAVLFTRLIADTETPVSALLKLSRGGGPSFLLESVEGGATLGRYSIIGLEPDIVWRAQGRRCQINRQALNDADAFADDGDDPLAALRRLLGESRFDVPQGLPSALACLVGYMSYETAGLTERLPAPKPGAIDVPDMLFVRPTALVVFDRLHDEMIIAAPVRPSLNQTDAQARAQAQGRIDAMLDRLAEPLPRQGPRLADEPLPPLESAITAQAYQAMVAAAKDYIAAGDIFQVVLAQRFSLPFALPAVELYRSLRRINPSPFLYLLDLPGFSVVGSSPEILVRVRDGQVTIRPIAGTRPRGADAPGDAANRASLLADPKELAEHLMLLDLGRNDVGRVAKPGTVAVTQRNGIEMYSHVMHIVSNVVGEMDERHDIIDALMAGFPAGTVSGAPKIRAMEIIHALEAEKRGVYAGAVGYFGADGSLDSCIVLRTAVVKDGMMHVQAGAGIVADSDPQAEQRECEAKAGALIAAGRDALERARAPRRGQQGPGDL